MSQITEIDYQTPVSPQKNINNMRLYRWGEVIMCDFNGKRYWTKMNWIRLFALGYCKFCYLTEMPSGEERKAFIEKREEEFKERVRKSLRSS